LNENTIESFISKANLAGNGIKSKVIEEKTEENKETEKKKNKLMKEAKKEQ